MAHRIFFCLYLGVVNYFAMPTRWTTEQEDSFRAQIEELYVQKNLSIGEISRRLDIAQSTVYARMRRLSVASTPSLKSGYRNKKRILLPNYSVAFAELIGILLGDGHISPSQVLVNLGSKETDYARHVMGLLEAVFSVPAKISYRSQGYVDVYIGSVEIIRFLKEMGLCSHKVREQVGVPDWILKSQEYQRACLRGLFDTDGSIYSLRHGWQISFCNRSMRLLRDVRVMLLNCGIHPSKISGYNLYISQKCDIMQFAWMIDFANPAKQKRLRHARVGTEVVKPGTL